MYSNMKYYENICNCLRVIQHDINRKLKSANCWQRTSLSNKHVDGDFTLWLLIFQGKLDKHVPIKPRRVKSKRLPDWFTPDILSTRRTRDTFKRAKHWTQYKLYQNKTRNLIRTAKKKHFSESITSEKDTRT